MPSAGSTPSSTIRRPPPSRDVTIRPSIRRSAALLLGLTLGVSTLGAQTPEIQVDSNLAIPLRDGVALGADLWRPRGPGSRPVLVYRTPYDRSETPSLVRAAVARGYAVLLVDVRGRYRSAGSFEPYRHEGEDGYDVIEWAAHQPWSNGRVGTFGLSYPGAVQWLAAKENPPSLRAMVPAMTYSTPESFWYSGGVWDGSWLDWVWYNIAPDLRVKLDQPGPRTGELAAAAADTAMTRLRALPLAALPDFKVIAPWYYEWMQHPPRDPWWSWADLSGRYEGVTAGVLNLSGWFDEPYGPAGAIDNFSGLVASGGRNRTGLVIGPWVHGVGSTGRNKAGDRSFGTDAAIDYDALVLNWLDRFMKSSDDSTNSLLRIYVMGANRWNYLIGWPPSGQRPDTLRLAAATRPSGNGRLLRRTGAIGSSRFRSDPAHPLTDPYDGRAGAHDYRMLAGQKDVLVFETAPLARPVEIIGNVIAELELSATVPDFDIWFQLYDVEPDGSAWNLSSFGTALMRASYRDGGPEASLVKPGTRVTLRLNRMVTANRFLAGHRIRVTVSGAFTPWFSRNLQTGALEFDSTRTQAGTISLHHPGSRVILPVVPVTP